MSAQVAYDILQVTTQSDLSGDYIVSVIVNGVGALCRADCNFTINSTFTPIVQSVFPSTVSDSTTQIVITGQTFGTEKSTLNIKVGKQNCTLVSVEDTSITCSLLDGLDLGDQAIEVITGNLNAQRLKIR